LLIIGLTRVCIRVGPNSPCAQVLADKRVINVLINTLGFRRMSDEQLGNRVVTPPRVAMCCWHWRRFRPQCLTARSGCRIGSQAEASAPRARAFAEQVRQRHDQQDDFTDVYLYRITSNWFQSDHQDAVELSIQTHNGIESPRRTRISIGFGPRRHCLIGCASRGAQSTLSRDRLLGID